MNSEVKNAMRKLWMKEIPCVIINLHAKSKSFLKDNEGSPSPFILIHWDTATNNTNLIKTANQVKTVKSGYCLLLNTVFISFLF